MILLPRFKFVLLLLMLLQTICLTVTHGTLYPFDNPSSEELLSAQLFQIIDFYKQPDPVGLPVGSVPDPMPIPPIKQSVALATMEMRNVFTHGLSKLRIHHFQAELSTMSIRSEVHIDELMVNGSYTLSSLLQSSSGSFRVMLKSVTTAGNVTLGVDREGILGTQDIEMDFRFEDMSMDFQNLGFMGRLFQSLMNSAPDLVVNMIKPFMLREVYAKIQDEIDIRMEELAEERGIVFVNSISPLDMALWEARALLRRKQFDPYLLPDYSNSAGIFAVHLSHTWLRGLASFYRSGDVRLTMRNNTADLELQVGTGRIEGSTQWDASLVRGAISRSGSVQFTVDFMRVTVKIRQPLDLRQKPELKDLQLEMGNIQVHSSGAGTLDYVVEAGANIMPNLLRSQIMDAIEGPVKVRVREKFECINVEQLLKSHVLDFERRGTNMEVDWRLCERKIPRN